MKILKEIKNSPFKMPNRKYYFGKLKFGTPYFWPLYFEKNIISIRKLKLTPEAELEEKVANFPWNKDKYKFINLPMARRSKDCIVKISGDYYFIAIGWPIKVKTTELRWKDKFGSSRFESSPSFQIFFFHWQFCIWYGFNNGRYWEQFLWWKHYCDEDIIKAEKTWPWVSSETEKSTWDKNYLK